MQKRSKTKLELMLAGAFPAAQLIAAWGTIENVETFVKAMFGFLAPGHVMVFMDYVSLAFFVGMMWAVPQLFLNGLTRWRRSSRRRKAQVKKHGGLGPGWFPIAKVVSVSEDYGPERDKELKAARDRIAMLETDREVARGREEVAQSRNKLLEDQLKATHRARDNEAQKTLDAEMNRAAKTMLGRGVTGPITRETMQFSTRPGFARERPRFTSALIGISPQRRNTWRGTSTRECRSANGVRV
jgi:hypothetical protein